MACHEVAALRLGLMGLLGGYDEAAQSHELAELGPLANTPGPLCSMRTAEDFSRLLSLYETSLVGLEEKLAKTSAGDPSRAYLQTLIVFTKKVELELRAQLEGMHRLCRELDEMHDFIHEIYPVSEET
jgi:Protein of unknown function (DUF3209)